jgi:hypothetical protein
MSLGVKAVIAWLILFVVMFTNGTVRVLVLQPRLGEDHARQVASLTGVGLVLLASWLFVRVSPRATPKQLLGVGLGWLAATVAFEFLFGHFVSGQSWSGLLADYDVRQGRLWSLIIPSVGLGPWLCGVLAGRSIVAMERSRQERAFHALSILLAAVPFAFALIRLGQTGYDARYIWVALASLLGATTVMVIGHASRRELIARIALVAAAFVMATLCAVLAAVLLGTTAGPGLLVVASAFGCCSTGSCVLAVLARPRTI